jgi:hypothetical protein
MTSTPLFLYFSLARTRKHQKANLFGDVGSGRISTIESGRRNAYWACIGLPSIDAVFSGPHPRETLAVVRAAGVTRTPQVEKSNADIQSSPQGEISRREGPKWPLGADGKSREQECSRHTARSSHHRAARSQVRHRQRADHAIAPTGHRTLVKAPLIRCRGRQDSRVRVTMPAVSSVWALAN